MARDLVKATVRLSSVLRGGDVDEVERALDGFGVTLTSALSSDETKDVEGALQLAAAAKQGHQIHASARVDTVCRGCD